MFVPKKKKKINAFFIITAERQAFSEGYKNAQTKVNVEFDLVVVPGDVSGSTPPFRLLYRVVTCDETCL